MAAVKAQQLIRDLGLVLWKEKADTIERFIRIVRVRGFLAERYIIWWTKTIIPVFIGFPLTRCGIFLKDPLCDNWCYIDGRHSFTMLGFASDGRKPIAIVPGGCWQGTKLEEADGYALCATTMVPPYDPSRYRQGTNDLFSSYPDCPEIEEYLR